MLTVQASNIGNTEASENRQGKGGDLRSKYYPTFDRFLLGVQFDD